MSRRRTNNIHVTAQPQVPTSAPSNGTTSAASIENDIVRNFALTWTRKGVPNATEKEQRGIFTWGDRNNYHELLYKLYNESAIHRAIIESKLHYITSGGIEQENADPQKFADFKTNGDGRDDLMDWWRAVTRDYLILGGFFVVARMSFDRSRITFEYKDSGKVRIAKDGKFHWKHDWNVTTGEVEIYDPYDADNPAQRVFAIYYRDRAKSHDDTKDLGIYPKPEYLGAFNDIIASIQIANFRMLEVLNGFKGGTMITMQKPATEEDEQQIVADIKAGAANTEGKGFITVLFTQNQENNPKIETLTGSDLDKRYLMTEDAILQNVMIAHQVTSPGLFGVKTAGQLGSQQELEIAFGIFVNTYISAKLNVFNEFFNWIWRDVMGNAGAIKVLQPRWIFETGETLADKINSLPLTAQAAVIGQLSPDELREMVGLEALDVSEQTDDLSSKLSVVSPLVATKVLNSLSVNEIRSIVSLPPIEGGDSIGSEVEMTNDENSNQFSSKDGLEIFAKFGRSIDKFKVIDLRSIKYDESHENIIAFEDEMLRKHSGNQSNFALTKSQAGVLDVLNSGTTDVKEISAKVGAPVAEVNKALDVLIRNGQIGEDLIPKVEIPSTRFEVVYQYALRPDAPPLKEGGKSRPFCTAMLGLQKVFSREEIDQISAALAAQGVTRGFDNYPDAWRYRGGWYHNPNTGKNSPSCRHEWQQLVVIVND